MASTGDRLRRGEAGNGLPRLLRFWRGAPAGVLLCGLLGLTPLLLGGRATADGAAQGSPEDGRLVAVIDTLAGGGSIGNGGPARAARISLPGGITEAPNGDLIVVDFGNHQVRRIDRRTGIIRPVAGTGEAAYNGDGIPAAQAQLSRPEYAVFGPKGDLFIVDSYNNRVRKIDRRTGLISTVAGTGERGFSGDGGPATAAELHFPQGIAVDAQGNLFIGDTVNRRIRRVDARTGIITTWAGTGEIGVNAEGTPALEAKFLLLPCIAIDRAGNVYVADSPLHKILIIDAKTRRVRTFAGTGKQGYGGDGGPAVEAQLNFPEGVVFAPNGDIYIADVGNHRVRRIDSRTGIITTVAGTGEKGFSGDGGPALQARLWSPGRLWVDRDDNLLVVDILNARIRRVDGRTKTIETVAGSGNWGDGGPANEATLSVPGDVVYADGKVYIADYGTQRIRCVDVATGRITTVAGGGTQKGRPGMPATEVDLLLPEGIAVHGKTLYIADNSSSRVWKVDLATGLLHPFAGTGEPGVTGDGGPAESARLSKPAAVSVGPDDLVYIADFGNQRVRVVDPATGRIRTLHSSIVGLDDPLASRVISLEVVGSRLYHLVQGSDDVRLFDMRSGGVARLPPIHNLLPPAPSGESQFIDIAVREPWVFLADTLAHRILRVNLQTAEVTVMAGNGVQGFSGDGGPAERAALFQPGGVAVSDDGREIYIADTKNHRVRRVRLLDAGGPG